MVPEGFGIAILELQKNALQARVIFLASGMDLRWISHLNNSVVNHWLLLLLLLSRFSRVRLCATPWTAAYQASPSMGFSRQEHWSGLPFPSPMHESGK